tara:strand:+ start:710 stop:2548 length:1839 start_codon:yes stop_codon:yes gene_type:complete
MTTKKEAAKLAQKNYLARDFSTFRSDLLNYARNYFPDQIQDFSEASLGGLLLEMAAYVGDTMSFYLDHQFNELNPTTAVESANVQAHARNAGVKPVGAAPATVELTFYIKVPAAGGTTGYVPNAAALPIIQAGTTISSNDGATFTTIGDLDFSETDYNGNYVASYYVLDTNTAGIPVNFMMQAKIEAVAGRVVTESFDLSAALVPFRTITLKNQDVSEVLRVSDSSGNEYYEVEYLTQDTVYKRVKNYDADQEEVSEKFTLSSAPYRYTAKMNFNTRLTTLQFGSGDADTVDDDIVPDPSELALPLYGKTTLSRFSIDPNSLLKTQTLGISPTNTTLSVTYRYGGGISTNVATSTCRTVLDLQIRFPKAPNQSIKNTVLQSLDVNNLTAGSGGANAPSLESLRANIFAARNQQSRIVTQEDLLARIYTLPSVFGRVFRAGIHKSDDNPLTSRIFVICQNKQGQLTVAPDALKRNMRTYLNEFRLISDAMDVLDATVINYGINFGIVAAPGANKMAVVANVISNLSIISQLQYFQIDQPLVLADYINAIINTDGVIAMSSFEIKNKTAFEGGRGYSSFKFNISENTFRGLVVGPPGSIFELKYSSADIVGSAV